MATVTIPDWAARLAADLLREYADRLSNDGCNDYDLPEWVPAAELMAVAPEWNNEPDMTADDAKMHLGDNRSVVGMVAHILSKEERD